MASLTFRSVRFSVYSEDHLPRQVHGKLSETRVIVALPDDGTLRLADRWDAIRPADAKRSDVRKILAIAAEHYDALVELWEKVHGDTSR